MIFTSSFKSLDDFRKLPAYALPSKWVLTNFINVFTKSHMLTYFKNSIIVLIGVLVPLLLFALMAGFALSKIKFKGRKSNPELFPAWINASYAGCLDSLVQYL